MQTDRLIEETLYGSCCCVVCTAAAAVEWGGIRVCSCSHPTVQSHPLTATHTLTNATFCCFRCAELLRQWSEEEFEAELASIRAMWQLAVVFEFLDVFKHHLKLTCDLTPAALEQALVRSTGPGMLAALHIVSALCTIVCIIVFLHRGNCLGLSIFAACGASRWGGLLRDARECYNVPFLDHRCTICPVHASARPESLPILAPQDLLRGISPGSNVNEGSWQAAVVRRCATTFVRWFSEPVSLQHCLLSGTVLNSAPVFLRACHCCLQGRAVWCRLLARCAGIACMLLSLTSFRSFLHQSAFLLFQS